MNKNYLLCIDLKTYLQSDAILKEGKPYSGELMMDGVDHVCFVEKARKKGCKRNMRVYYGQYVTMTYRMTDGHIRFNFREVNIRNIHPDTYAMSVMNEIRKALKGLVGE